MLSDILKSSVISHFLAIIGIIKKSISRALLGDRGQIVTAQCARLTSLDTEVCGGMIHTVEKPLKPSTKK